MATFVLVHGAADSSFHWSRVEPLLRARGHEVVTMDLPAADPEAGLREYVATVLDAMGDRQDVVVVGQSLGGFTAGQIPRHRRVAELVYLNAMIPRPGETAGDWWANTGHEADMEDEVAAFLHLTPPALAAAALEHGADDESGAMDDPFPDDVPAVPTRVLQAADDRFFTPEFMRGVARDRLGLEPVLIPGDHCAALSRPEELVAALLAP